MANKGASRCVVEARYGADAPDGMCFQLELVRCTNPRCKRCPAGDGHGPYWYAYSKHQGRTISVYLGRTLDVDKARQRLALRRAKMDKERGRRVTARRPR